MKKLRRASKKGFTLVELIVTITVMAILASAIGVGIAGIARSATENNCKNATRNYFSLVKAAMAQINSGVSVYSNGIFTSNEDIATLVQRSTGYAPVSLVRLEDNQATDRMRPFATDKEGYYVGIRYADPALSYPVTSSSQVDDNDRVFFVEAVYYVSDSVCYACLRSSNSISVYK